MYERTYDEKSKDFTDARVKLFPILEKAVSDWLDERAEDVQAILEAMKDYDKQPVTPELFDQLTEGKETLPEGWFDPKDPTPCYILRHPKDLKYSATQFIKAKTIINPTEDQKKEQIKDVYSMVLKKFVLLSMLIAYPTNLSEFLKQSPDMIAEFITRSLLYVIPGEKD